MKLLSSESKNLIIPYKALNKFFYLDTQKWEPPFLNVLSIVKYISFAGKVFSFQFLVFEVRFQKFLAVIWTIRDTLHNLPQFI